MGWTNFPNGITSMGMPALGNGVPATFGDYWFVAPTAEGGSDGNNGKSMSKPFATTGKAITAAATNNHDVICLSANAAHVQTDQISLTKNRLHFVGLGGGSRYYGQRTRITMGVTTGTAVAVIQNTGVGNTFTNIKFDSSDTLSTSVYAVAEGGEYAQYTNCEFYKSTDLDQDAAAELLMNGDSSYFLRCTFGSTANAVTATGERPCVLLTRETITGKVCRDATFEDCIFWRQADGGTTNTFVYTPAADDVERMLLFKNCLFFADITSSSTPDVAVDGAATLTVGRIVLMGCAEVGCTALATATGIWSANATLAAAGGSALQAT